MENTAVIPFLFFATLLIALVYGGIQYFKAKKAQRENHHSVAEKQDLRTAHYADPQQGEPVRR